MESTKVTALLAQYKEQIPSEQILVFKDAISKADDRAYDSLMTVPLKNPTTTLLLSIFLGGLGVDRFFVGDVGLGVAKLLLGWFTFGIWPIVDIFFCYKKAKVVNLQNLLSAI